MSRYSTLENRFWDRVGEKQPNGCILWTGCTNKSGYGLICKGGWHGKMLLAHRVAYELMVGPIPDGLCILHRCDTPACVNAAKCLFQGTRKINNEDKVAKGRSYHPIGELNSWSKLTDRKAQEIFQRYQRGGITEQALADEYGVCVSTISNVICGNRWTHIFHAK